MSEKPEATIPNSLMDALAHYYDVPCRISVEIGRRKFKIAELMTLTPNSVLQLKKPAGEPLDVCINGHHVARGEVVVVEQTAGLRIIEVFKPATPGLKGNE